MGDTRRMAGLALASVLAFGGLAACGDDGGDDDVALEDVEGEDTGSGSGSGTEDTSETTIDLGDIEGLSGECEVFAEAAAAFGAAFSGGESSDFGDLADAMAEFADEAPEEIRGDIEVLAEAYATFAEEFGDLDFSDPESFNDPEVAQRLAEAGEIFNSPEVAEANENLTAFTEENCSLEG